VVAERGEEDGAAVDQGPGEGSEVAGPGGGAEQFDSCFLERSRNEEVIDDPQRAQAFGHRSASDQRADPEVG
jgi:hypothetical protein